MSITEAEYNPKTNSLEVAIKFFIDDLELVLEKENDKKIFLGTKKEDSQTNAYLKTYLSKHFILEQDKGSLHFNFIGKELDQDYVWVYLEFHKYKVEQATFLTNSLLINYFPEQTNKVNFEIKGIVKSFTLHKNNINTEF